MNKTCPNCGVIHDCGCSQCHNCEYDMSEVEETYPEVIDVKARTQKRKGILALVSIGLPVPDIFHTQLTKEQGDTYPGYYPAFARPCPTRPRHGFVDSRVVNTLEDVKKLSEETYAADPEAEILYMRPIDAKLNAIWNPHLLTVGDGHDGATAGKGAIMLPLVGAIPPQLQRKAVLDAAGFNPGDYPYVEAVFAQDTWLVTQLRAGPPLENTAQPDYIPQETRVKRVIPASVEIPLLEWEAAVLAMEDGDVVYHPAGSLSDHISVHARTRKIPVLKTREPQVGELLLPIGNTGEWDPAMMLKGAAIADEMDLKPDDAKRAATNLLLVALHNSSALTGEASKWIGAAAALMLRLGSIACRGELRHHEGSRHSRQHRDQIYNKLCNRGLRFHRASLRRMANVFRYGSWPRSGYGGPKWAACALSMAPLYNALGTLAKDPSSENAGALLRSLNVAVNQAHNGGWWLNKFTDENAPDQIQKGDILGILLAGSAVKGFEQTSAQISATEVDRKLGKWSLWRPLSTAPPPIEKIEASIIPYSGGLQLSIKTRLTRKGKEIEIPYQRLTNVLMERIGDIVLTAGDTGLKVTAQRDGESVTLWEEPPIDFGKKE